MQRPSDGTFSPAGHVLLEVLVHLVVGDNMDFLPNKPAEEPVTTPRGPSCQPGPQERKEPQQKWKKA